MIKDEWETPQYLFNELNSEFDFTLDVCATIKNTKCENFFSKKDDALNQSWFGRCFMNPPYSRGNIDKFVRKAYEETVLVNCELVVGVLPTRTSTKYFHEYIYGKTEIRFLKGRIKFCVNNIQSKGSPREDTMIVIWRKGE